MRTFEAQWRASMWMAPGPREEWDALLDFENSNGSYESCLLLSDGFFCVKPSVESPPRYISIFSGNCSIILNLISIFISIYQ